MKKSYYAAIGFVLAILILMFYALRNLDLEVFKLEFSLVIFVFFLSLYGFLLLSRNKKEGWRVFLSLYLLLIANGAFLFYASSSTLEPLDEGYSFLVIFVSLMGVCYVSSKLLFKHKRKLPRSRVVKIPEAAPEIEIINDINPQSIKRTTTRSIKGVRKRPKKKR
ncbi:hypothetical protein HYY69_00980 [Candidatus Woesearchaeota archaeon]|nr:hypothetical protein [Candidatus Woesearchaeota archaeon]